MYRKISRAVIGSDHYSDDLTRKMFHLSWSRPISRLGTGGKSNRYEAKQRPDAALWQGGEFYEPPTPIRTRLLKPWTAWEDATLITPAVCSVIFQVAHFQRSLLHLYCTSYAVRSAFIAIAASIFLVVIRGRMQNAANLFKYFLLFFKIEQRRAEAAVRSIIECLDKTGRVRPSRTCTVLSRSSLYLPDDTRWRPLVNWFESVVGVENFSHSLVDSTGHELVRPFHRWRCTRTTPTTPVLQQNHTELGDRTGIVN